ncbi:nucleoside-diphosphate-sugar epimerase [Kitasatospora gansuensis]|uniref:Nucleoside-diphosphate-sugar epimerase n=1 Tax=Kitasatospora gansuensis TaxID=258050 RepID=A0A7W7SJ74_9ACTN|nr:NAD-dependent epimerase/dehydratase family protein [Kitasatospora gansuensis]MBB4951456.1 nucleoside-diphosphate-sugar epimerase [Kitasatospora gansuensis]
MTGGTGFVGAHSVAAVLRAGCRVRLLVRDPAAVGRALLPLGVDPDGLELVVGDVTDQGAVTKAVDGAEVVLHAASVYSFDSRRRSEMLRTNVRGTELVLAAGRESGARAVIHVSSVGALFPAAGPTVRTDSPVGRPREAYLATKAAAEAVARRHQQDGAPVVISYPPALLGPDDPYLGDQNARLRNELRGLMPLWPGGGLPVGDVRDTAAMHAGLVTGTAEGPARHFGPQHFLTTRQYVQAVREATGRRLPAAYLPARAMLPFGLLTGAVQHVWPWHIPAEYGAVYTCAVAAPAEGGAEHGVGPRPLAETMADTIAWLHARGHLTRAQAGRAAGSTAGVRG